METILIALSLLVIVLAVVWGTISVTRDALRIRELHRLSREGDDQ